MSNSFQTARRPLEVATIAELGRNIVARGLPGITDEEIRGALQIAYRDFCRLTSVFTNTQEIELEDGEAEYPVVPYQPETFVDSVLDVRLDRRRLVPERDYWLRTGPVVTVVLASRLVPDAPTPEQVASRPELTVVTRPAMLYVTDVELPKLNSERAPRWFFNKYGDAVVAGALVKLFGMTGRPWTDGVQAQHELVRWENFLTETRLRLTGAGHSTSACGSVSALDTSVLL